ncbi:hypothetical protein HHK36_016692 [Tetracentron sinense]|uniref:RING-type E3 ubiquitin transferase n=1 Tax=Tetracentron sinense TaxID=13715 RepID=A0A834Z1S0_TETSI|nr:hypothetical protein HHK36_016692 [Tetracentron sinense]
MKPHNRKLLDEDATPTTASPSLSLDYHPITPLPPPSTARKPFNPTSTFDSSMALTVLVLLTALFFMGFFSVYVRRFAEDNAVDVSHRRTQQRRTSSSSSSSSLIPSRRGLDPSIVGSLPLFSYDGNAKEPFDCVVCLTEFEEKETVKMIPYCRHVFHPPCIDMWFSSHGSCPLCRSTQLFAKVGSCLSVVEEGSTVGCGDTSIEIQVLSGMMRRASSCSSLGERMVLQRSSSF